MRRRLLCGTLSALGLIVWLSALAGPAAAQGGLQPIGPPFRISDAAQTAALPTVASAPDGSFLVVWLADLGSTPASYGLFARATTPPATL